jgi:predicted dehydrogenase
MTGDALRVGLLGFGLAGGYFHAPLIAATAGLRLAIVVTANPERRQRAEREHAGVSVVDSADDLWKRADELDLVVIATPNASHASLAHAAIERGLAVVVDKPLATSADAARSLVEAARARGTMLTVFQNRRWDGDFLTVRRLLADGALGRVHRFESRFERWRPSAKPGWRESGTPEDAGGILFDLGSHLIDQAIVLFGPVSAVYAEVDRRRPDVRVDDDVFVSLEHESGVHSHLWMSALTAQLGPRFRMLGDRAGYVKEGLDGQEAVLRAGGSATDAGFGIDPPGHWGRLGTPDQSVAVPTERGAWTAFYAGVVGALRKSGGVPVEPSDSVAVLDIIERARRAGQTPRAAASLGDD